MKTLKQLVDIQDLYGIDDLTLIKYWFINNNREQDGLALITGLVAAQTKKIQDKYDYAVTWVPSLPDLRKEIANEVIADKMNDLQTLCALSADITKYTNFYEWAKENIPKTEVPKCFFRPTIEWLKEYGIEFISASNVENSEGKYDG